ncbi:MAG: nucleotidyltransferase family protein [Candidatus Marinimicrobia bacterium]|jgi:molybdenum cofactor cytidylyltransferase|nr:nucleotidyltransferase family protein [Candidatus Neomarinimicrobiota bacterium]|tara:strand:- start:42 stop:623 length:582 start_codon:yes stop_codon:yes gene_type:complete
MKIAGLILAAGGSSRMGDENKLMMPFQGKPMLNHVVNASLNSNLTQTFVVVGHQSSEIKNLVQSDDIQCVENEQWETGMASSIVAGISQLKQFDGFLILLGDMPLVTPELINEIIVHSSADKIVIPIKDGLHGNPVFFGSKFRDELLTLYGDSGAKKVIQNNLSSMIKIKIQSNTIFKDYDTKESLESVAGVA